MFNLNSIINISTSISFLIIGLTLKYNIDNSIETTQKNIITQINNNSNKLENKFDKSFNKFEDILTYSDKKIDTILDKYNK